MQNIVRTIYGADLQSSLLLNKPYVVLPYSTLNEKLNINASLQTTEEDRHSLKYLAIGNGGHRVAIGANNIPKLQVMQHLPKHAALYNQLPFILRLPNDDLLPAERLNYRLRKLVQFNGITYVAYYLKVIDTSLATPSLELRTIVNGNTTSSPFAPSISDLSPVAPPINSGDVLVASGDYIASTSKVPLSFTSDDIDEFINVCNIIYNDDDYAIISEMALCAGVDRAVTGDFNGVTSGYTDAIAVQITNHIATSIIAKGANDGINIMFDIGSVEPLLVIS